MSFGVRSIHSEIGLVMPFKEICLDSTPNGEHETLIIHPSILFLFIWGLVWQEAECSSCPSP